LLKQHGVDLIVTDHHQRKDELPDVYALIHPEIDESYPFHHLCGAGVALKIAQALLQDELHEDYYVIAMMGTIGDVVPLVGENRSIVKRGLKQLKITQDPGLLKLIELTGSEQTELNEVNVGFELCPRLNAPGRMDEAMIAVELLVCQDEIVAADLGEQIQSFNQARQAETQTVLNEAMKLISEEEIKSKKVILLHQPNWHEGILGIVAGRLARNWGKAVFVLSDDHEGGIKGSARAIEGYHLFDLLNECQELITKFGGHALAAGISFPHENLKALDQKMNELLKDSDIQPIQPVDLSLDLEDIDLTLLEQFEALAPFGEGNRPPVVKLNQVSVKDVKCIGNKSQHLKFVASNGGKKQIDVIGFNMADLFIYLTPDTAFDLVGELKINEWNGNRSVQLQLIDLSCHEFQLIDLRNKQVYESNMKYIQNMVSYKDLAESIEVGSNLLLDTLPKSVDELLSRIKKNKPNNVILGPLPAEVTFAQREKFIFVYKIVKQQKTFQLTPEVYHYFSKQGISKNELLFILQVFFEVELVIINNGIITETVSSHKRDLSEAPLYQTQAAKVKTLEFFELSTFKEIKAAFIHAREENSNES
ncbi:MAG TPA: single-stranded-DNA-specific exonuclease RecJ, partial [Firmicutes bacterium]|nr:single-stranded-DNA-specific exonuclease RecJ [Bacillota bacterium]